jgi:hypothetical protein
VDFDLMDASPQFYWYEIKPDEQLGARWAQVIGAIHRLRFICDELMESATEPEIEKALERLAYNAENYLIRAYELREQVVSLIATLSGASSRGTQQIAGDLKSAEKRQPAIANVRNILPKVAGPLARLLAALDDDIKLRNFHPHNTFLQIGLWTGNDIYDPADALVDLQSQPKARKRLEALLRKGAKRLTREYERKADCVIRSAMALVKSADPHVTAAERHKTGV